MGRHCLAVAQLLKAAVASVKAGVSSEDMAAAAMLHDYGKIFWPRDLFYKDKQDLSLHDLEVIASHPHVGRRLVALRWLECPETVLRLVESHHSPEGWLPAQLLAACDVWVACHEDRPYRTSAMPEKVILREMLRVAPESVVGLVTNVSRNNLVGLTATELNTISF